MLRPTRPLGSAGREPNPYAAGPLERADHLRQDQTWLSASLTDPETRFVPVWRSRNLMATYQESGETALTAASAVWLAVEEAAEAIRQTAETVFLGLAEGRAYVALDLSHLEESKAESLTGPGSRFRDLREVGPLLGRDEGAVLAYARGLVHWHNRHRFCGVCGRPTESTQGGHVRLCTNRDCGASHFPRTDPAVIMLVHDGGDRCVLGRQRIWPPGMHSTLAGFVETGESLEDAVAREVQEEVGLALHDIHYHSSQPWPFPSSIMLGFHAEARHAPLEVNTDELESAAWYSRADLVSSPEDQSFRLPRLDSIARRLIHDWLGQS